MILGKMLRMFISWVKLWDIFWEFNPLLLSDDMWWQNLWQDFSQAIRVAWQNQAIIWTSVASSLGMFCGIYLRAILQEVLKNLISNICLEVTLLELLPHLPGANELMCDGRFIFVTK